MDLLLIALTSIASAVLLFILTKLMGNKEMSQLSMFDYITGITIGSIAAEMATDLENFEKPLVALIVYALITLFISVAGYKSIKIRRILNGKSLTLYENGNLYEANLKKSRIDVNEFLTQCRVNGFFNISDLQTAILEPNGKISFLPLSYKRPVIPEDLKIIPQEERPLFNVIIDGKILKENLKFTGNNEAWLMKQLKIQGINQVSDVFLATCDYNNKFEIYKKISKEIKKDIFD